jgi:zinc protease
MLLYLLEDHTLPKVEGVALIRTGDRFEPADKTGLAGIVGQVMRTGGTAKRPGEEIDRLLENLGAVVETGIGTSVGSASVYALKEDLPTALEILADILRHPAFPENKIELAQVQERTAISRRNDNVMGIASREFVKLLYGSDSPYARSAEYATIDNITRQDLIDFHARYFHPNEVALGLWGDFDSDEVKALVKEHFGDWARKEVDFPSLPEVSTNWDASVNFIPKDDINQTNLRMGHLGGRRDDPDYFALRLMSEVLGGGFSSRLFRHIRTELGLAYAASATWRASWDHPGSFFIFCNTKSESTMLAIDEIVKEVRRITEEPVTEDELRVAKEGILNSWVFNFDTTGELVQRMMTYDYYGYPRDFLAKFKENIDKVTQDDILRAAKKNIQPDKLVILAVGREEDFDKPLSTLGDVNTIDITIPQPQ